MSSWLPCRLLTLNCPRFPSLPHVILRACECFEFLLLLGGVLFGGKRPREFHRAGYVSR